MPEKTWYNHLERRPPYYGFDGEVEYRAAAASLTERLFDLLEPPYTSDDSPAGGDVTASVTLCPEPGKSPYDLITVNFLAKSDEFSGAPIVNMEMRNVRSKYDRIDEISIHYIEDRFVIVGASYDISKDNHSYYVAFKSHLHNEIAPSYITHLENIIDGSFVVAEPESSNF